jgi:hypothetical protein
MTKTVTYREWSFEVDYDRTIAVYDKVEHGSPEGCVCHDCKNFSANRENIYPQEFKNLLADLGIDYKKESEIYHMAKLDNGLHHYGGWYHFKGKMIKGKDCKIQLGKGGSTFDTIQITDKFWLAFTKGADLAYFDKSEFDNLIQIEFITDSEWIIEKKFESE